MNLRLPARTSGLIVLVAVAILFFSCARDPHVRKQKYLPGGKAYFGPGKYREATMEYVKATRIDQSLPTGAISLRWSYVRREIWTRPCQKLARTANLQPTNPKTQVDLGTLLLSAKDCCSSVPG